MIIDLSCSIIRKAFVTSMVTFNCWKANEKVYLNKIRRNATAAGCLLLALLIWLGTSYQKKLSKTIWTESEPLVFKISFSSLQKERRKSFCNVGSFCVSVSVISDYQKLFSKIKKKKKKYFGLHLQSKEIWHFCF